MIQARAMLKTLLILALSLSVLGLSGCSWIFGSSEDSSGSYKELTFGRSETTRSEISSVQRAQALYGRGLYRASALAFEEFIDNYPLSAYAELAEAKIADSKFVSSDFESASGLYFELFEKRTKSELRPYYALMAGRSAFLTSGGAGRDVSPVKKSLELYTKADELSENSAYSQVIYDWRRESLEELMKHEELIADFYESQGHSKASSKRRLKISSLEDQLLKLSGEEGRVMRAALREDALLMLDDSAFSVECRSKTLPLAVFSFGSSIETNGLSFESRPLSENGGVEFELSGLEASDEDSNNPARGCSEDFDFSFNGIASLSHKRASSIETLVLENPKRLFVIFR